MKRIWIYLDRGMTKRPLDHFGSTWRYSIWCSRHFTLISVAFGISFELFTGPGLTTRMCSFQSCASTPKGKPVASVHGSELRPQAFLFASMRRFSDVDVVLHSNWRDFCGEDRWREIITAHHGNRASKGGNRSILEQLNILESVNGDNLSKANHIHNTCWVSSSARRSFWSADATWRLKGLITCDLFFSLEQWFPSVLLLYFGVPAQTPWRLLPY